MEILNDISRALQNGKAKEVRSLVDQALASGVSAKDILNDGLLAGMNIIGVKFKNNEVYVPDVLIAARAMKAGTEIIKPQLVASGVKATGTIVLGTVKGDLHDIGKNLVGMMMEGKGIEVIDLGTDVTPERFVEAAIEHNAKIICASALLTTTMGEMKGIVEAAKQAGVRDRIHIMIGGAPVNDAYAQSIGADKYTADAASAADAAVAFLTAG